MKGERERAMTITIPYDKSIVTAEDKGYSATVVCCGDLLDAIAKAINDLELQTTDNRPLYNAKLICLEDNAHFKKGYIYTCKNGRVLDDYGDYCPYYNAPCKTLEDMLQYGKFIELKGEN